jgi:hypothetical protein
VRVCSMAAPWLTPQFRIVLAWRKRMLHFYS